MNLFSNMVLPGLLVFLLAGCELTPEENLSGSGFNVRFSDGTSIGEQDISFYDSSTCLLFLKKDWNFSDETSGFEVGVNDQTIYHGVIQPCYLSSMPPEPYSIPDCFLYRGNVLQISFTGEANDLRNDPRIIDVLERDGLLHHGLSCRIDSVRVSSYPDHATAECVITVTNHDRFPYLIPDPAKMGNLHFLYYTGGLSFTGSGSTPSSFLRWS